MIIRYIGTIGALQDAIFLYNTGVPSTAAAAAGSLLQAYLSENISIFAQRVLFTTNIFHK